VGGKAYYEYRGDRPRRMGPLAGGGRSSRARVGRGKFGVDGTCRGFGLRRCRATVEARRTCDFFTAVGDDDLAERALSDLAQRGVAVHAARRTGRTRRALVLAGRAGERTIVVHGARHHPRVADDLPWHLLESADCAVFTAGDDSTPKPHGALRRWW